MSQACKSCGAPIRWLTTLRGKQIPIDPEPVPNGNVVIEGNGRARVIGNGAPADGPLYQSHFASCPSSAQHRRRT